MKKVSEGIFVPVIRLSVIRETDHFYYHHHVTDYEKAAELGRILLEDIDRECLVVCCLDGKLKPLSLEKAAVGTVNECIVSMREIFKYAVLSNASYLLVFHNHPSGEAEPSEADIQMTERLREAGELMGIPVMDHIILGDREYVSFAERFHWSKTESYDRISERRAAYVPSQRA